MRKLFLFWSCIFATTAYGQKSIDSLIKESKNTGKPILIHLNISKREPELLALDPIDMTFDICFDGGCKERINQNFLFENFLISDENAIILIEKYHLHNFPITLILDSDGELITKCNSYSFGNEEAFNVIFPILTKNETATQLKEIEKKMYSATIEELKKFISIKDSLNMTDTDMIDLFVEKANENDYDKNIQDLLLRFTISVNSTSEYQILTNLSKYSKKYIQEEDKEFQQSDLIEDYRNSLFRTLCYAYRVKDDQLFMGKIIEAKKSIFKSDRIDEIIKIVSFQYFKVTKRPEDLFLLIKPSIEKELLSYNPKAKIQKNIFGVSSKVTLATNLNNAAYSYYESGGKNVNNLKKALSWSIMSNTLSVANYAYLDTYARLLYAIGNKTHAIKVQKKALILVKELYRNDLHKPSVTKYLKTFEYELIKMQKGRR